MSLSYLKLMPNMPSSLTRVYFDGLCQLCTREIEHYRHSRGSDQITFVDITHSTFDAAKEGVDPKAVHKVMHVLDANGVLHTEVDAFIAIWEVLPGYRWLVPVFKNSAVRVVANVFYDVFAAIRPWLPKRDKSLCADSPYCELPPHKNNSVPIS
jgi:predicted DCC family thiol-disulfide oxidoreductase YuxK